MPGVYLRDSHRPVDNPDLGSVCKGVVPFVHEPTTTTRTDRRPVAATRVVAAPATPVHRATGQEAAAKATAAAEVARAKAEQARQRAEQERQDANQRYLDVLVTEHESARTAAVTALGEAREALAVAVKVATERFAGALVAWGEIAYRQAIGAYDEASNQIKATSERRRRLIHQLTELESSTQYAGQAIPVRAEYDTVCAGMRPHCQRRDQAGNVAQAIEHDLRSRFGDEARGAGVEPRIIDRYVSGVVRAAA